MKKLDPSLERALRAASPSDVDEARLSALASRIQRAAEPLLLERRIVAPAWWNFPASWSRMLIPAGLVIAAASLLLLLRTTPRPRDVSTVAMGRPTGTFGDEMVEQVLRDVESSRPNTSRRP
jgi:hypothetical protein